MDTLPLTSQFSVVYRVILSSGTHLRIWVVCPILIIHFSVLNFLRLEPKHFLSFICYHSILLGESEERLKWFQELFLRCSALFFVELSF